jgi:hypothetical protein
MRRATGVLVLAMLLVVAGGSLAAGAAAHAPGPGPGAVTAPRGMGGYQWKQANELSDAAAKDRLRLLRDSGVTTVYLELGDYLGQADERPSRTRNALMEAIRYRIRRFVAIATSYGLAVHALGGGPRWVGEGSYLGRLLVDLVGDYNARARPNERLRGVQLDIEPYVLEDWLTNPGGIVVYLAALDSIVKTYRRVLVQPGNRGLQLGFAIPFWLDGREEAPPAVRFQRRLKPAVHHLVDMIWDLPTAYLVVMSYREDAGGDNGSIRHARDELDYAARRWARCGLLVAQQYGPPVPEGEDPEPLQHTTFYRQPKEDFWRAAAAIVAAFRGYRQFRGLALDGVDDYRAAPDRAPPEPEPATPEPAAAGT